MDLRERRPTSIHAGSAGSARGSQAVPRRRASTAPDTQVQVVATWTDNRGNCSFLNKLVTTRFPSSAVVRKLAAFMKKRRLNTTVHWAPRGTNREADALANGVTAGFNPKLECVLDPAAVVWTILPEALQMGREAERAFQEFQVKRLRPVQRHAAPRGTASCRRSVVVSIVENE